jgi:transposase
VRLAEELSGHVKMQVLMEAGTESEWVARCLEGAGHHVVVADPNFAPMYATRSRRVKTDRRDARTLAEASRLGAFRASHRVTDEQRHVRDLLGVRDAMVAARTQFINTARSLLRRHGFHVRSGGTKHFPERVRELPVPGQLLSVVAPLLSGIRQCNAQIDFVERSLELATKHDADVQRLQTLRGVGLIISAAFVAVIDGATRFRNAHQVESYVGLVPRELSSGEKQHRGRITKAGSTRLRKLMVQAGWSIWRSRSPEVQPLRQWAARIAERRGKRIAIVALARRMAGILWAMLRDRTTYQAPAGAHALAA